MPYKKNIFRNVSLPFCGNTYNYEVDFGESETTKRNWGHEFYPTFMVCIHMMSSETMH